MRVRVRGESTAVVVVVVVVVVVIVGSMGRLRGRPLGLLGGVESEVCCWDDRGEDDE